MVANIVKDYPKFEIRINVQMTNAQMTKRNAIHLEPHVLAERRWSWLAPSRHSSSFRHSSFIQSTLIDPSLMT
jgi:hypothetical protein